MERHGHAILVVEDNPDTRDAIALLLELHDYDVFLADDGLHALNVLRAGVRPCLILLDVNMPRMDGAAFRRAQIADAELREIPVAVLTALPPFHTLLEPFANIPTHQKPVDAERLIALVQEYCPQPAA
jgi:two-component system, chemotaxis family, chemotaxis protein CheY